MPLAFFMKAARLSLVQPLFTQSFCQVISFAFWSLVKFRLAKFMQFSFVLEACCMSLLQQPFPLAKDVLATNATAANTAKVVLIMPIR